MAILVVFTISLLALVGWSLDIRSLKSIRADWISIKTTTTACLLLCAVALALVLPRQPRTGSRIVAGGLGILVALVGLLAIAAYVVDLVAGQEASVERLAVLNLLWMFPARMALLTAVIFLITGSALTLLATGSRRAADVAHAITLAAAMVSYLVPVTYLLDAQALHEWLGVPVALNTGVAFCAVCIALFCIRPDTWLMRVVVGEHAGGAMARRLLPALLFVPVFLAWLGFRGHVVGLFGLPIGLALLSIANIVCLLGIVWLGARAVNRTDDALRREQEFVSAVLDTAGALVVVLDTGGRIVRFNRACKAVTGYSFEEVQGRCSWDFLLVPEEVAPVQQVFAQLTAGQFPNEHENYWVARDGTRRLIHWTNTCLTDSSGGIEYIIATGIDITERRRAEQELAWQASFPRLNPNPVAEVDLDGQIYYMNPAAEARFPDLRQRQADHPWLADWASFATMFGEGEGKETVRDILIDGRWYQQIMSYVAESRRIRIYGRDVTSRKQMEIVIEESKQRYATTLASIGDAVIATDVTGKITFLNAVAEKLTGWTRAEALEKPAREVFHIINEFSRQEVPSPVGKVLEQGVIVGLANHTILVRRDGSEVPIDDSGAPIKDKEGKTTGVVLVFRDITARKRAAEVLANERAKLQMIFDVANVGLILINEDRAITRVNNVVARWMSKEPAAFCGEQPGDALRCIHALSVPAGCGHTAHCGTCPIRNTFDAVFREGEAIHDIEAEAHLSIGGNDVGLWLDVSADPLVIDGRPHVILALNNITELKRAEEALRTSEERFRLAAQCSHDYIFEWDMRTLLAEYFGDIDGCLGYAPGEFPRTFEGWMQHVHPDDLWPILEACQRAFQQDASYAHGYRMRRKDGTYADFWDCGVYIRDAAGNPVKNIGAVTDITEANKRQSELRKLNRTLAAHSHSDQAMMRASDEAEYLQEICKIVVEDCGHAMVWIGYAEDDEGKAILPVASSGFEEGYLETLQLTWADTERGRGPTGTAIRTGKMAMCRNMLTDPQFALWRDEAIRRGYASSIVLPLLDGRKAFGAITTYSKEPDPFSEDEATLLSDLAGDLAFGILTLRARMARNEAETRLRRSAERFRLLSDVTARLLTSEDPQAIVEDLCRDVMRHLECECFFNFLADDTSGRLRLNACAGISDEEAARLQWLDYGVAVCGCAAQQGCRIVAEDIRHTPDPRTELVKSYGVQAYACHPLLAQRRVIGTLSFGAKNRIAFLPDDLELMRAVADKVAFAMQRILAQREIEASEERLRLAQQNANEGVWDWSLATGELTFSPELNRLYGLEPGAIRTYQEWRQLVHLDDIGQVEAQRDKAIADHQPFDLEFRFHHRSGEIRWMAAKGAAIYGEDGATLRILGVNMDITARKRMEQELARSNKELEQFAYIASHDLQEPLRQIVGFTQFLDQKYRGQMDETAVEFMNYIVEGGKRMQELIRDLLAFSRAGRGEKPRAVTDVQSVLDQALLNLRAGIEESGAVFTQDPMPTLKAIGPQLMQVFQNLISNGIKFRGEATPAIHVGARQETDHWLFWVRDNGIGFDEEYQEKIFQIFQRLHTRETYPGSGIGLPICKRVVEHHGGRIWAESEPEKGSTFYFTIPVA